MSEPTVTVTVTEYLRLVRAADAGRALAALLDREAEAQAAGCAGSNTSPRPDAPSRAAVLDAQHALRRACRG